MEMADGIVINKCDGNNVDKCQLAATQFRNALHLFPAPESGWTPQVLTYSGFYNLGVKEIWDMVYRYMDFVKGNGYFEHRRNEQSKYWMYETINEQLRNSFFPERTNCIPSGRSRSHGVVGTANLFRGSQTVAR